ncbi:hypothetical protein SAMN02927900_00925 [Rhizobium mongolense subsp. loessense]|uniref:Uncharacterized protein n=1 Tax=Rhizobium mongolense subsp. loessense TaxID=158890 RepID=A0A1G4PSS4_9HYPH|nr:hypothetical protein SAMN02927900_00925 [Rhizobium mongolense subsp. loessense]
MRNLRFNFLHAALDPVAVSQRFPKCAEWLNWFHHVHGVPSAIFLPQQRQPRPFASVHWRSFPSQARACPGAGGRDDETGDAAKKRPRQAQAATASPSARPHAPATDRSKWSFWRISAVPISHERKTLSLRRSQHLSNVLYTRKPRQLPSRHSLAPLDQEWQNGACESRSLYRQKTVRDLMEFLSAKYRNPHSATICARSSWSGYCLATAWSISASWPSIPAGGISTRRSG